MPDHHQLVDQIRAFVQASDQTRNAVLESLAAMYAEACVEVNQRMGRCHRLLQQGLRSEAIQLAESEPNLLDSLAALDFPERGDWDELVQIYELAPAPKLLVEQAQFLNEAYAQEDPLQDLLRMHRRLALQRAPIKSRIAVMRKLAAQDVNNPIWTDDLRTFEKARFRQVQAEATQAVQGRDLTVLSQLLGEMDQQTWVEPPPKALVQGLRKADAQFRGQQTRAALADLDARLNDAFAARDPIRGRLARQDWIALTASAPLAPTDAIWERVQPPLHWLEEEDHRDQLDHAHEEAIAALLSALDDPAHIPSGELERLAHSVLQYGRGMPEEIQRRYVSRLTFAEGTQKRRLRTNVAVAAAAVLLVGSLSLYHIRSWARSSDASQAASTILDMIELGEVEQVSGFLEKLQKADPGLLSYPAMIEARQKFQVIQDRETDRIAQFDKTLRAAEQAPVNQLNPPELEAARKLARQQPEKHAVEQLVERRAAGLVAARASHEKAVSPRLEAVGSKIDGAQQKVQAAPAGTADESEILGLLTEARHELADLESHLPFVGENVQGLAAFLAQKIDATHAMLEQRKKRVELEEDLDQALAYSVRGGTSNMAKFAADIDNYIKSFPDEPRAQAFKQTRDEQALWQGVEEWNRLLEEWKDEPAGTAPRDPKARAEQCGRFLSRCSGTPDAAEIALYQKYLEAFDHRGPGPDSAVAKIERLLSDILVESLWMLKVRESDTRFVNYYVDSQPGETTVLIRHLVGFDAKKRGTPIPRASIVYSGWSPQTKIANKFRPILVRESTRSDWEKVMIDLASAIRADTEIDPVLQVALLRSILELAAAGSEPLRDALTQTRRILERGEVNVNVPWMDPEDEDARKMRPRAAHIVQSLPEPFSAVLKRAQARRDEIERQVRREPRTVGWLAHEQRGWRIRSKSLPRGQDDLWVIAPQEDKRGHWKKIGTITGGKAVISGENHTALAEGRPVLVMTHSTH